MFQVIMWDIDGTILDFLAAEKAAIKKLFPEFGLGECTDEMISRYSKINRTYWERLERKELTKPEVLVGRYVEFFETEGLDVSKAPAFNDAYQIALGDTVVFCDDCLDMIKELKGRFYQVAASNGTIIAQNKKLKNSGLDQILDDVFLSEKLGHEKPAEEFFTLAIEKMEKDLGRKIPREEILIVGDSLTSDIRGGNNAGIKTCWYNPRREINAIGVQIDYEVSNLSDVLDILER